MTYWWREYTQIVRKLKKADNMRYEKGFTGRLSRALRDTGTDTDTD